MYLNNQKIKNRPTSSILWVLPGNIVIVIIVILLLLLKLLLLPAAAAQTKVGKTKIVYKLLSQPHKHLHHGKLKNRTQGSNQRFTAPLNPSNVHVPNTVQGRSFHTRVWVGRNTLQIGTFYILIF